jgi:hypothetical protein
MWVRILNGVLVVGGLLTAAYLGWAYHRMSDEILRSDRAWPRPWPYPDNWLYQWERRLDAEDRRRSAELGHTGLKMEGEELAVRIRVGAGAVGGLLVTAVGIVPWAVRHRRRVAAREAMGEAKDYADGFRPSADAVNAAEPHYGLHNLNEKNDS